MYTGDDGHEYCNGCDEPEGHCTCDQCDFCGEELDNCTCDIEGE